MNKKLLIIIFIIVALAQLYVPVSMIIKSEVVLNKAEVYKFKTRPVDPYDAFRGRYVALGMSGLRSKNNNRDYKEGDKIYALIVTDKDGFSRFGEFSKTIPKGEYLEVVVKNAYKGSFSVENPFDRYYMNEEMAPEAEKVYEENSRRGKRNAYIAVKIEKGKSVIEGLYIGDMRIEDFIKKEGGKK